MLGIDIGSYSIKVAYVKGSAKKPKLENFSYDVLPLNVREGNIDANSLRKVVGQLIKKVSKNERNISVSVSSSSAVFKTLSLDDSLSDDLLEGEVQLELVNFVPFPLAQVSFDYKILGPSYGDSGKNDVFVVATKREFVDKAIDSVSGKSVKAKNKYVDIDVFSLSKLTELKRQPEEEVMAIFDVGYKSSSLSIFDKNKLIFTKEMSIGGHQLTEAIAEINELSLNDAEQIKKLHINQVSETVVSGYMDTIGEQLILSIDAYQATSIHQLSKIYVAGGGSALAGFSERMEENLMGIKMIPLRVSESLDISEKIRNKVDLYEDAALAVSVGLGMRKGKN